MRVASSAFALLAVIAVPSVSIAQVLTLARAGNPLGLPLNVDHQVPVATVSLAGDIVALGGGRIVQDPFGEPFMLGAATLDRHVASEGKIVFSITNVTDATIALKDVVIYERTMLSSLHLSGVTVGAPFMPTSAAGWGPGDLEGEELPSGASMTIEVPLSPLVCSTNGCQADGFVVFVGRRLPHGDPSLDPTGRAWIGDNRPARIDPSLPAGRAWVAENPIFTRAFLALISQARRPTSAPF